MMSNYNKFTKYNKNNKNNIYSISSPPEKVIKCGFLHKRSKYLKLWNR